MAARIRIYSTPNCNLCNEAKKYFTERGVDFDLVDVTRDREALEEMKKLTGGARTAPVISIGDRVLVGFRKEEVDEAMGFL